MKRFISNKGQGFTIVELLTVAAVMSILLSVAVPALSSMAMGNQMNRSLIELSGTLDHARQYAIAHNTYVWVALRPNSSGSQGDELSVALLASKTGTDPSPWSNYGSVPNAQIDILTKPRTFENIRFEEANTFSQGKIPSLAGKSPTSLDNTPANNKAVFNIKLPGNSSSTSFNRVIQFTPTGEARVSSSVIDVIEFGVHPTQGKVATENNVAVLRVNGLTGQTTIFRP